jgi:hypothetical protein
MSETTARSSRYLILSVTMMMMKKKMEMTRMNSCMMLQFKAKFKECIVIIGELQV